MESSATENSNNQAQNRTNSSHMANSECYQVKPKDRMHSEPSWRSLLNFMTLQQGPIFIAAIASAIISGIPPPALAIILGRLLDEITAFGGGETNVSDYKHGISTYCIALSALAALSWLIGALFLLLWRRFGDVQEKACRDQIFDSLLERSVEWYDLRENGVGALLSRTQTQILELHTSTSQPLGYLIQYLSTATFAIGLALYLCWDLALITLATIPISAVVMAIISRKMQTHIKGQAQQLSMASKHSISAFNNIETVKCFNGQAQEIRGYSGPTYAAAKYYRFQARINALQIGFVRFMTLCMFVQGFWYGAHLVISGRKSAGVVITAFWACLQATQTIEQTLSQILVLEKGKAAGYALRTLSKNPLESGIASCQESDGMIPAGCSGDIEFRDVSFAYPSRPGQVVLRGVNMFFAAGEMTFVVGQSGSGKSTLGQLLMKFYQPASGTIYIDEHELSKLDTFWLRSTICLVEQQSHLFRGTIFENISMARRVSENLKMEDVKEAIQFAMLNETINSLTDGVDTIIGPRGTSLSGGQKQRLQLAQARLRDTQILILDESTSALDHVNRSLVMAAVRQWRKGKTTIVISHDMSQIANDDFVYVMKEGCIIYENYAQRLKYNTDSPFYQDYCGHKIENIALSKQKHHILKPQKEQTPAQIVLDFPVYPSKLSDVERDNIFRSTIKGEITAPRSSATYQTAQERRSLNLNTVISSTVPIVDTMKQTEIKLLEFKGRNALIKRTPASLRRSNSPKMSPSPELYRNQEFGGFSPDFQDIVTRRSMKDILTTIWPCLTPLYKFKLLAGFGSALIDAIATPLFGWIFAKLLGTFYLRENKSEEAFKWSIAILILAVINGAAAFSKHYALECCGQAWVDSVRVEAFKRVLHQPQDFFASKLNSTSSLVQSLDRDADEMRNLLGRFAAYGFIAVVMTTIAVVWSLIICWKLALVALATLPVVFVFTKIYDIVNGHMESRVNIEVENCGTIMTDTFTNIKTVRGLTLETTFRQKYQECATEVLKLGLQRAMYSSMFFGFSDAIVLFVEAVLYYFGAYLTWSGQASVQEITEVFSLLLFTLTSVVSIINFIPQIGSSRDSASRLFRLAELPLTSHETTGSTRISSIGDIFLNNLTYHYPGRSSDIVLSGVSLGFPRGSKIAIVGRSGSGKSTIASLLVRLYPTMDRRRFVSPQISIDRRDISRIHTATLRNLVSIVSQHPVIFPGTVLQNIVYGLAENSPKNTTTNARKAARATGIHDFILSLPQSYETLLGDGGTDLSGGQAQRIAIARALIRKPDVLILDEATSALDPGNAQIIRKTIQRLVQEQGIMTVIIITHHEDMMKIADKVVMLDDGRILEEGTYEALVERNGAFAALLRAGILSDSATRGNS